MSSIYVSKIFQLVIIMKDKYLLLAAIEDYGFYTSTQRKLLKALVNIEMYNTVKAPVLELSRISNMSKASVYRCIDLFKKDGLLELSNKSTAKLNEFTLNPEKLEDIKDSYLKKHSSLDF